MQLKGEILELVGEFLDERLPTFIFTNRISFKTSFQYKIDIYEIQRQILSEQLGRLVSTLPFLQPLHSGESLAF